MVANKSYLNKYDPYPVWHRMCSGSSEVPVDNDDSDENTDGVHDEREQQVLNNQSIS